MFNHKAIMLLIFTAFILSPKLHAHSGGTDSSGCHHDRKNGGYQCHKAVLEEEKIPVQRNPASALPNTEITTATNTEMEHNKGATND